MGDAELIFVDGGALTGTSPSIDTTEIAAGSNSSLTGESPALAVEEMQPGRPSYTASYQPVGTGAYQVRVVGWGCAVKRVCRRSGLYVIPSFIESYSRLPVGESSNF